MKNLVIASTSTVYGEPYLRYLIEELEHLYQGIDEIVFIPYARPSGITYDEYTQKVNVAFCEIGKKVRGLHEFDNPVETLQQAKAFFTGGGNTFLLLKTLYDTQTLQVLKQEILKGKPYLGTSAGSNITGQNIRNTNDMPIVYPPTFDAMGILPFNINPHYLDPQPESTHMGETRETRIKEYLEFNDIPVIGLREGSWLHVTGETIQLKGNLTARWFSPHQEPIELPPNHIF